MTSPIEPRDDLSALLDGELDDAELAVIEQELEGDAELRVELEELRGISDGLRSLPHVTAPDGFLAAVMGRIDAGEGLDEPEADVAPIEPLAEVPPDNVVRMSSWWVKGPVLTAVAALLLVGIGIGLRDQGPLGPPAASELVMRSPAAEVAPRPTGLVSDRSLDGDALADAGVEDEEALSGDTAERIRMTPGESGRVAVGGAGTGPAVPSAPRRSGIREADSSAPPLGIVAVAEAEYAPEPEPEAVRGAVAMADEPLAEMAAEGLMPRASAPAALGVSDGVASPEPGERQAMTAVASLRTGDAAAVTSLRDVARSRGWALTFVSPGDAAVRLSDVLPEQVVELLLPPGDEIAAQTVLDGLGAFQFASTPERGEGASSRLRITIIYAP